jgi:LAO/AO transport system kinase
MDWAASILAGNRLALSRLLTQVENGTVEGRKALNDLFPHTGNAHLVGITGAPGTGKSSLVSSLTRAFRQPSNGTTPLKVAVVAVDPSSPFSGGAVLGDRVRMRDLSGDPGVFIRSMASRGALGGLARATAGLTQVLDAYGFDLILIETVGAGQAEVDIASLAHTTLVVEAPGMGDEIQAIKAGILEIADILVVNKADRSGADSTEKALRMMLEMAYPLANRQDPEKAAKWVPPILQTIAVQEGSAQELAKMILRHRDYLLSSGEWQRREKIRLQKELDTTLQVELVSRWKNKSRPEEYQAVLELMQSRQLSPDKAVDQLLENT